MQNVFDKAFGQSIMCEDLIDLYCKKHVNLVIYEENISGIDNYEIFVSYSGQDSHLNLFYSTEIICFESILFTLDHKDVVLQ